MYAAQTYLPFPAENIGSGKIYRSPMPTVFELNRIQDTLGVSTIVQLCFDSEFAEYDQEETFERYSKKQFDVIKFPIEDFKVPVSKDKTRKLVDEILAKTKEGQNVLIHCVGGKGRTGLIVACIARKVFNCGAVEAVHWVRKYVPGAVESTPQQKFIDSFFVEDSGPACENEAVDDLGFIGAPSSGEEAAQSLWEAAALTSDYHCLSSTKDILFKGKGKTSHESSQDTESSMTESGSPESHSSGSGSEWSGFL